MNLSSSRFRSSLSRFVSVMSLLLLCSVAQGVDPKSCDSAKGWSKTVNTEQVKAIFEMMGTRGHRLLHALWHATRAGLTQHEKRQVINAFGETWDQSHPLCPAPENNSDKKEYNPAGEDFLYMHRQMIEMVRNTLIDNGLACIEGWSRVPTLDEWPLPDEVRTGAKSPEALEQLMRWDSKFQDDAWLKTVSLSQVGWALEFTVHNNLHMRFASEAPPAGFKGVEVTGGAPIPYNGTFPATWQYDQPGYDWLADPYGAAINPTFWKIHGYVDHVIDLWLAANKYTSISEDCKDVKTCYTWKGTWSGEIAFKPGNLRGLPEPDGLMPAHASGTLDFNQKRMQHQRVGVLTSQDLNLMKGIRPLPGAGAATVPNPPSDPSDSGTPQTPNPVGIPSGIDDPITFTNQKLCGAN